MKVRHARAFIMALSPGTIGRDQKLLKAWGFVMGCHRLLDLNSIQKLCGTGFSNNWPIPFF